MISNEGKYKSFMKAASTLQQHPCVTPGWRITAYFFPTLRQAENAAQMYMQEDAKTFETLPEPDDIGMPTISGMVNVDYSGSNMVIIATNDELSRSTVLRKLGRRPDYQIIVGPS